MLSTPAIPRLPSHVADEFSDPGSQTTSAASAPSHVYSIPPEILIHIFVWLITLNPIPALWSRGGPAHTRLAWIVPTTHVCKRWRAVAIANPCLWTEINHRSSGVHWALEMTRRARQAPVAVTLDADCMPLSDYVVEHIDHVRYLELKDGAMGDVTTVLTRLNRPAPMLESVNIFCDRMCAVPCPADLFAHTTPRLRHVWTSAYYVPPNHTIFLASLFSLKFINHLFFFAETDLPPKQYTYDEVLDVLERMPALEVLYVHRVLSPGPASMGTSRSISLPRLNELSLGGVLNSCCSLAANLDLPAHTSVHMICHPFSDTWEDCQPLVPFMARRVAAAAAIHAIEHLAIYSLSDKDITLTLGPLEARRAPSSALPFNVDITFSLSSGAIIRGLVEAFCAVIPLGGLQELSVFTGLESWWRLQHWQEMLRPAQCVETVNVRGAAARHLVSPLRMESRAGEPPDEAPTLLFPALKTLALWELLGIHDVAPGTARSDEELAGALASRTLKAPLETLKLLRCKGQKEWIETFEAIVPTVTVDSDAPFPPPFRYLGSMHEA